jgi:hypothetical protein
MRHKRVLAERTGLKNLLSQFYSFGDPERTRLNNRARQLEKQFENDMFSAEVRKWYLGRFISTGYYALVEYTRVNPVPDDFSSRVNGAIHIPTTSLLQITPGS